MDPAHRARLDYPAVAVQTGQEGVVAVEACIDTSGRLTSEPTVAETSGFPLLDEAALKQARDASGHFLPATLDGQAIASCYRYRVRFQTH